MKSSLGRIMEYMLPFLTVFVHIVAPDFVRIHGVSKYASIPPSESDLCCALLAMSESCGSAHAEHVSLDWCDQSMQRSTRADEANVIKKHNGLRGKHATVVVGHAAVGLIPKMPPPPSFGFDKNSMFRGYDMPPFSPYQLNNDVRQGLQTKRAPITINK